MGRLFIPAVNQIDGPWLLSHENLETLDDLFKVIDEKLRTALSKHINSTAKLQMEEDGQSIDLAKRIAKLQRKYNNVSKSTTITFVDGSTFEAYDVKEVLHHVNSHMEQSPDELYIRTMHGNHENEFNLVVISNPEDKDPDFEYQIRCLDYDIQLEIKTIIDKWIRDNKPPQLLQIWSNGLIQFVRLICIVAAIVAYSNLTYTISKEDNYRSGLKQVAQQVIENKEGPLKIDSAIILLLKLQANYVPNEIKAETTIAYDKTQKKLLVISLVIFACSLVYPKTTIGVGKRYFRYRLYKFWWKYIICGGIGLFLTTLLADVFLHFIRW